MAALRRVVQTAQSTAENQNNPLKPRLCQQNWSSGHANCYARYWVYPSSVDELGGWIEDAYSARTTRAHLIQNSQDMMKYNAKCRVCGITH